MDPVGFVFSWQGAGVLKAKRELKTKDGRVFKHVFKVAGLGETFEIEVTPQVYAGFGEGQVVRLRGTFGVYNGVVQFIAEDVTDANAKQTAKAA